MKIKDILDNIGKKIIIVIASIFMTLLIIIAVILTHNSSKKDTKTPASAKVNDSSVTDESADKDSSKADSSVESTPSTTTDNTSTSVTTNPNETSTKAPITTTKPSESTVVKYEVVDFISANTTPKYDFPIPLFERIYGKSRTINGNMGKYLQQGDTVKIRISSGSDTPKIEPIGDVSIVSFKNGIATIKISDTAKINVFNDFSRLPDNKKDTIEETIKMEAEMFAYKVDQSYNHGIKTGDTYFMFGVFEKIDWITNEKNTINYISNLYSSEINLEQYDYLNEFSTLKFGYTNGDVAKSFMKCTQGIGNNMKGDDVIRNDMNLFSNIFSTFDFYKRNGYRICFNSYSFKTNTGNNFDIEEIGFVAK